MHEHEGRSFEYDFKWLAEKPDQYIDDAIEYLKSFEFKVFMMEFAQKTHRLALPNFKLNSSDLPLAMCRSCECNEQFEVSDVLVELDLPDVSQNATNTLFKASFNIDGRPQIIEVFNNETDFVTKTTSGKVASYRLGPYGNEQPTDLPIQLVAGFGRGLTENELPLAFRPRLAVGATFNDQIVELMEFLSCFGEYTLDMKTPLIDIDDVTARIYTSQKDKQQEHSFTGVVQIASMMDQGGVVIDELFHTIYKCYPKSPATLFRRTKQPHSPNEVSSLAGFGEGESKYLSFKNDPIEWRDATERLNAVIKESVDLFYTDYSR